MLKDFIQWLLNTRTTPAQAAHSAMPGSSVMEITPQEGRTNTVVMPFDGYAFQNVLGNSVDPGTYSIVLNNTKGDIAMQCNSSSGSSSRVILPCSKGDSVSFVRRDDSTEGVYIKLIKAIGGGIISWFGGLRYA